jgi:CRP-like cAMP-binding protein
MSSTAHNSLLDLLNGLPTAYAKSVTFEPGEPLASEGDRIERVVFPTSGLIACATRLDDSAAIETALLGKRDAIGGAATFGMRTYLSDFVACFPSTAWSLQADALTEIAAEVPTFRAAILNNEWFALAQAQQTSACCARHSIRQRFATWLLRAAEATMQTELPITQEAVAGLLGVQRASLSMAASDLQAQRLIEYRRGRLWIRDSEGLEHEACGCVRALREKRAVLLANPSPVPPATLEAPTTAAQFRP